MLKAGTPERIDQEPVGTGPFYLVQYQKDAQIATRRPRSSGRQGQDRDLVLDHPGRIGALGQAARRTNATSCRIRSTRPTSKRSQSSERCRCSTSPLLNVGYLAYNTTKKPFERRARAQGDRHGDQQEGDHRRRVPDHLRGGENPIPATPVVRTTTRSRTTRSIRSRRRRSCWPTPATPTAYDRPVGGAGAAAVHYRCRAHRRADAGRPCQGRRDRRDQELESGAYRKRHAGGRAPDGACSARRRRRSGQVPGHAVRLRLGEVQSQQRCQFCYAPFEDLISKAKTTAGGRAVADLLPEGGR